VLLLFAIPRKAKTAETGGYVGQIATVATWKGTNKTFYKDRPALLAYGILTAYLAESH
jgi:hypothetical protein